MITKTLLLLLLGVVINLGESQPVQLCDLASDRKWMCDECIKEQVCKNIYGLNRHSDVCSITDVSVFNRMYKILVNRINNKQTEQMYLSGNSSCVFGSTIATALVSAHGNVCSLNERPQINAAKTNIFCMCIDNQCGVEYTDSTLNTLLLLLVITLLLHLCANCVTVISAYKSKGQLVSPVPQQWKRMVVLSDLH